MATRVWRLVRAASGEAPAGLRIRADSSAVAALVSSPIAQPGPAIGPGTSSPAENQITGAKVRGETRFYVAICVLCLVLHAGFATAGLGNTLSDRQEFRQTQTAITTYYVVKEGFRFDYVTPVLGPPWSIPMEFPLYQWLVAAIVILASTPLEATGRLVSLGCFYASMGPIYYLLGQLVPERRLRLIPLSILLASPFYVYWSRTFLIESLALFLCCAFAALAVRAAKTRRPIDRLAAALLGSVAGLVKVTTFLVFCAPALLLVLTVARRLDKGGRWSVLSPRRLVADLTMLWVPLIIAGVWTRYADQVKSRNPMASWLQSTVMAPWNFGTLDQRLHAETWLQLYENSVSALIGPGIVLVVCACAALLGRGHLKSAALCVGLFLLGPLVFTNLYYIHDYYFYATGIFLVAAVGFVVLGLAQSQRYGPAARTLVLPILLASMYVSYLQTFYEHAQRTNVFGLPEFARTVQAVVPDEQDVLLVYGMDWNPALAYYSQRRALMDREGLPLDDARIEQALHGLGTRRIGAMIIGTELDLPPAFVQQRVERFGLGPDPVARSAFGDLYAPATPR